MTQQIKSKYVKFYNIAKIPTVTSFSKSYNQHFTIDYYEESVFLA